MFTKIIFTIIIVIVVWKAFRYFARLQDQREKRAKMADKDPNPAPPGVEDMVKCSLCESYVARGSKSCGKEGCPFRG